MKFVLLVMLFLTGCGSAQLVSTRYRPKRMGTVKLDIPGPAQTTRVQRQAAEIMEQFCAPQKYEIVGTDQVSEIQGAYASPFQRGAVNYGYKESPLVHFECVD
jgi:hypothetical protein